MEQTDLIQKAQSGDMEAFVEWMDKHSRRIELFIIQNGYSETSGEYTEVIFRRFLHKLTTIENEEQAEIEVFRLAVTLLAKPDLILSEGTILKFEEDELLHKAISRLKSDVKIPFVLAVFHKKSLDEIKEICGCSKAEVQQAIKQAELLLPSENLVKKVEFLAKSYNRVQLTFKKENVLNGKIEVEEPYVKKSKIGKKSLLIWVVGILLLVAIVTVPVVTSEEYRTTSAEKYIEQLPILFEEEVQKKYAELGLVELDEKEITENYYSDIFGKNTRFRFSIFEGNLKKQVAKGYALDKKKIKKEYNDILKDLELPSDMVANLNANPLVDSEEESEEFIQRYIENYYKIQHQYYYSIGKYEDEITKAVEAVDYDNKKFIENKESYSEELKNLINAMETQNIELLIMPGTSNVFPTYMENGLAEKVSELLYENLGGYMVLVQSSNYYIVDYENPDLDKTYANLRAIEDTLMKTKPINTLHTDLKSTFITLFEFLTFGFEPNQRFGSDGTLKEEYRDMMSMVAGNEDENSPSAFAMKKVIEFMEANDWKEIEDSYRLTAPLYELIDQAREGEIESFDWESRGFYQDNESGELVEEVVGYQAGITERENPEYRAAVQKAYKALKTAGNNSVLIDVEPIVVLGVYLVANEQEDPGTMWILRNREKMEMTKEEYVDTWHKQALELHGAEKIFAEKGANESNGVPLVPIQYELSGETIYDGWLKWNEDSQTWEIEIAPERTVVDG